MQKIIRYSLWLTSLLGTFGTYAQSTGILLDDLAYALEDTTNRREVFTAMQAFHTHTQVGLAVATVYENGTYAASSQGDITQWLGQQTHGITLFITVSERTKAFQACQMRVSEAVEFLLPLEDREQIQKGLLEFYFRNSPIPSNAYTSGLLAGIAAMEKKILENKEKGVDTEPEELPSLVKITDIDEEFSAGIKDYAGNKLNVSYAMKKHKTYDLKTAKFEVYDVEGNLVYDSEKEEKRVPIKEEGQFTWDGKMNIGAHSGKFIQYENSPFMVKLIASTNAFYEDVFEADTTARVDEDADKWNDFKFKDAVANKDFWSYEAFKDQGVRTGYDNSLTLIGESKHPLDYLNESLVPMYFFEQGPITLNIRFAYVLKLFELSTKKLGAYQKYKQLLKGTTFSSKLRMSYLTDNAGNRFVSNHGIGFAIDLDAAKNPMIEYKEIYHFIEFVTGVSSFYGRRSYTNEFIDELKSTHNTFTRRLEIDDTNSGNDLSVGLLEQAARRIAEFDEREDEFLLDEAPPPNFIYSLHSLADNEVEKDVIKIRNSVEALKKRESSKKDLLSSCHYYKSQLDQI